jgi:hypothetical protein
MSRSEDQGRPKAQNVADRPHQWTVALSLAAAAISLGSAVMSLLSLNEARENRKINEQTARAYLKVTSLLLDRALFSSESWAGRSLTGFVTITNTGRVAAKRIETLLDLNPPRAESLFDIAEFAELPPGSSNTVRVLLPMTHSKSLTSLSDTKEYILNVKLRYVDGFSREERVDDSSFCLPFDKAQGDSPVSLYSCEIHFASAPSDK